MSAPFRAQAYNRVVLLQTAAEWAETTDKVLQDFETGRETDTGLEKTGDGTSTWAELAYDFPRLAPTPREITAATGNVTAEDNGGTIICNRGSAQTITVDPDLGVGFNCLIIQIGAGQVTLAEGSGVTLNNADSFLAISAQYGAATLYAYAADTFYLGGQLA